MKFYDLKPGQIVTYIDNHGAFRYITFVRNVGLVKAIYGEPEALQQQFMDERGNIVHLPINAWKYLKKDVL